MRIILVTDPPWVQTANAKQMVELAHRLQKDMHTVYWMPVWGFKDGGTVTWQGIEVLPGDDHFGNDIIRLHAHQKAAHLVITRGWAGHYDSYGGSHFGWWAWHPGPVERRVLRKSVRILGVDDRECKNIEAVSGTVPFLVPRGVSEVFTRSLEDSTAVQTFKENHDIPADAFVLSAIGPVDPHWKRMLEAFKLFHDQHEEAVLYLQTDPEQPLNLFEHCNLIGLPLNTLRLAHGYDLHIGYYDATIAAMYHASDVHLVPGMAVQPIIESLACGTPALTTDRPEAQEAIGIPGLGAMVPPITIHEGQPLLDVEQWAQEMENATKMSVSEKDNHSACCQMVIRDNHWDTVYANHWSPMLKTFEEEERDRINVKTPLECTPPDPERGTAFVEDLGFVEELGCEVVRKTDLGGNTQDERAQNEIVKSWGPHPNVISILRDGEDEFGRYYFDTPKLAPLRQIHRFTPEQGDKILADTRAALEHMHQHGCAHCDINARNTLLTGTEAGQEYDCEICKVRHPKWLMGDDMSAIIFDFDFMQSGLDPYIAYLCDYEPLNPLALPYAVPVMASGIATRGFHRTVTYVRNLDFEHSHATSHPDMPYQKLEGVGERDSDHRWGMIRPDVKGKRVVDLGCNLGYFASRALEEGAASVFAVDRDEAIVDSARKAHRNLDGNVSVMDLNKEMPEGEFDVAFCLSIWQHLRAGKRPLLEFLKRIPVTYWEDANFTKADLEAQGFKVERLARSERGRNLFKLEPKELVRG